MQKKYDLIFSTPLGFIGVVLENSVLTELDFLPDGREKISEDNFSCLVIATIRNYFVHPIIPDLPLAPHGTPFQIRIWNALRAITPGQVFTYGKLAQLLGTGPRAIGGACRANPLPILIPCHRVIGATNIGGYSSGLDIKKWLLNHEGVLIN